MANSEPGGTELDTTINSALPVSNKCVNELTMSTDLLLEVQSTEVPPTVESGGIELDTTINSALPASNKCANDLTMSTDLLLEVPFTEVSPIVEPGGTELGTTIDSALPGSYKCANELTMSTDLLLEVPSTEVLPIVESGGTEQDPTINSAPSASNKCANELTMSTDLLLEVPSTEVPPIVETGGTELDTTINSALLASNKCANELTMSTDLLLEVPSIEVLPIVEPGGTELDTTINSTLPASNKCANELTMSTDLLLEVPSTEFPSTEVPPIVEPGGTELDTTINSVLPASNKCANKLTMSTDLLLEVPFTEVPPIVEALDKSLQSPVSSNYISPILEVSGEESQVVSPKLIPQNEASKNYIPPNINTLDEAPEASGEDFKITKSSDIIPQNYILPNINTPNISLEDLPNYISPNTDARGEATKIPVSLNLNPHDQATQNYISPNVESRGVPSLIPISFNKTPHKETLQKYVLLNLEARSEALQNLVSPQSCGLQNYISPNTEARGQVTENPVTDQLSKIVPPNLEARGEALQISVSSNLTPHGEASHISITQNISPVGEALQFSISTNVSPNITKGEESQNVDLASQIFISTNVVSRSEATQINVSPNKTVGEKGTQIHISSKELGKSSQNQLSQLITARYETSVKFVSPNDTSHNAVQTYESPNATLQSGALFATPPTTSSMQYEEEKPQQIIQPNQYSIPSVGENLPIQPEPQQLPELSTVFPPLPTNYGYNSLGLIKTEPPDDYETQEYNYNNDDQSFADNNYYQTSFGYNNFNIPTENLYQSTSQIGQVNQASNKPMDYNNTPSIYGNNGQSTCSFLENFSSLLPNFHFAPPPPDYRDMDQPKPVVTHSENNNIFTGSFSSNTFNNQQAASSVSEITGLEEQSQSKDVFNMGWQSVFTEQIPMPDDNQELQINKRAKKRKQSGKIKKKYHKQRRE